MHLIYVLSLGHSGSTLLDLILGTHPDFLSSGELRYLPWQLYRTKNKNGTSIEQNICTCGKDFRDCKFWKPVFMQLNKKLNIDIVRSPTDFDISYFGRFSFQERAGFNRSLLNKSKSWFVREWIEHGYPLKKIQWIEPKIEKWIENNWLLFETMSDVSGKEFIIDSTKSFITGPLLQQYRPEQVTFIFIHRSIQGLAASYKRWSLKTGRRFKLDEVIKSKFRFDNRIKKYKSNLNSLSYLEVDYEYFVQYPYLFLLKVLQHLKIENDFVTQSNDNLHINPQLQHLWQEILCGIKGSNLSGMMIDGKVN